MNNTNSGNVWRYALFNLVVLALISAWIWQQNQPIPLAEPKLAVDGKLQCVSYAPYYGEGQTPLIKGTHISQAQIEKDLKLLAKHSQCVRIYSVNQGLDYVPVAASKIGLKVLLGAWIGWVDSDNVQEINLATRLANQYPDTVVGLIVGNEVLLRGEQTEQAMADYIKLAKQSTKVPVTYADVWEYWLRHPTLESSVDFVTVHVLPYWEDDPQPVSNAMHHVNVVMDKVTHAFTKPILIGETGWPSAGRQRNASVPSTVNQARYIREFLQRAEEAKWNYNVIEAVDQPWKRFLEGAVGGYWGIYDTNLNPKFSFSGTMAERQDGLKPWYWATAGLLIWLAAAVYFGERHSSTLVSSAALGASAGLMALLQLGYLVIACRDTVEWIALGGLNILGIFTLLAIPFIIAKKQVNGLENTYSKNIMRISLFVFTLCAAITGLLLMPKAWVLQPLSQAMPTLSGFFYNLDGRYRDFPLTIYLLPVLQLSIGLWLAQLRTLANTKSRIYRYLNVIALLTMLVFILSEPLNMQAYAWLALAILLAIISWPRVSPAATVVASGT
ncbi:beta-1,6-glucan synthase [Methylotenera versatilis]|uniref:glycoside hydrolase family 17 protein n=1 Tax=Methylotenera versatilis TaxID=1055487 RepID=UPI0006473326|nr:beta-1,6-glucan synthase [Methylotenera versatilis]